MTPEDILSKADCCVKCGLCLPACPTYRKTANEAESPRGRISLIQAVTSHRLASTPRLQKHLDLCLMCRACETACPSGVAYGEIMDAAREAGYRELAPPRRFARRVGLSIAVSPRARRLLASGLAFYQRSGLQRLMRASRFLGLGALARLDGLLPPLNTSPPAAPFRDADSLHPPRIALFTGCVSELFERAALESATTVLRSLGREVSVPAGQTCCGAMHRHAGAVDDADELASRNLGAFPESRYDKLLCIASACTAELQACAGLGARAMEISRYLCEIEWPREPGLRPLDTRIAVHEPCSHRNLLADNSTVYRLLRKIPAARVEPLANNQFCCGAAGLYMLTQPEMSDALLEDKMAAIRVQAPQILVTTNTGCALRLAAGIRNAGLDIEVLHPVQLIHRQIYSDE